MSVPRKIALIGSDATLVNRLRHLPQQPIVEVWSDLYSSVDRLGEFVPDVLVLAGEQLGDEEFGALRLLRSMREDLMVVVIIPHESEVHLSEKLQRTGGRVLLSPFEDRDLAACLSRATAHPDQPDPNVFVDLARGLADEINNPLLFAKGYLQLLEDRLQDRNDATIREHLATIARGLSRVAHSVEKLELLHRASRVRPDDLVPTPLTPALSDALRLSAGPDQGTVELDVPDSAIGTSVLAEPGLLNEALAHFSAVARELAKISSSAIVEVHELPAAAKIRLDLADCNLSAWQLPRTFDPYYLSRVQRGSSHGLALFLVQTIVHALGGQATAQRIAEGPGLVRFEILLPRAR